MLSTRKKVLLIVLTATAALFSVLRFSPFGGLEEFEQSYYSLAVYSSSGSLISVLPLENGLRREYVPLESIDKSLIDIVLQSEDSRFFLHCGFDMISLIRAVWFYSRSGEISSGASTISMQLSRIINPRKKDLAGKILEVLDAIRLETRYSKKEILEAYINHIPFGFNLEGIQSASRFFLGKTLNSLSREELLVLMMIPRRPEAYTPLEHPERNRAAVLRTIPRIREEISHPELEEIYTSIETTRQNAASQHPHFIRMIRERLSDEQWRSGKPLYTSLDDEIQTGALAFLRDTLENTGVNRISNGAVLAIENSTGRILAYVGSADFYDDSINGQIDGVLMRRQPGSTLKPFLYAKAMEVGFSPSQTLPDIPQEFGSREIYIPENYNEKYNGPVRFSVSLGSSLNVPAVYLLERIGVDPFLDKLVGAGFSSLENSSALGVGLALGNGEVSLYELVRGFSVFSRKGEYIPLVYDLDRISEERRPVFRPEVAETMRKILSDNRNRILGFGRSNPLDVDFDAAFKTGTSNQFNNIWAVGSTQDMTVGVWMGNFSGETVIGSPGSSYPARIVVAMLDEFHKEPEFTFETEFYKWQICPLSGGIAGHYCPYSIDQEFPADLKPHNCKWHKAEGTFLPAVYNRWNELYNQNYLTDSSGTELEILQPSDGALFFIDPTMPRESQEIAIRVIGRNPVILSINGEIVYKGELPFTWYQPVEKGVLEIFADDGFSVAESRILIK